MPSAVKNQQIDNPIATFSLILIFLTLLPWGKIREKAFPSSTLTDGTGLDLHRSGADTQSLMAVPTSEIERLRTELNDAYKISRLRAKKLELEDRIVWFRTASSNAAAAVVAYKDALVDMQAGKFESMHRAEIAHRFDHPLKSLREAESMVMTDEQYQIDKKSVGDLWDEAPIAGGLMTTGKRFDLGSGLID